MAKFIRDGATLPTAAVDHIGISNDDQAYDLIPKANLRIGQVPYQVIPNWNGQGQGGQPGQNYPYPTKTILTLQPLDGQIMYFELQDLSSTCPLGAFNTGTKADLEAAVQTVASW